MPDYNVQVIVPGSQTTTVELPGVAGPPGPQGPVGPAGTFNTGLLDLRYVTLTGNQTISGSKRFIQDDIIYTDNPLTDPYTSLIIDYSYINNLFLKPVPEYRPVVSPNPDYLYTGIDGGTESQMYFDTGESRWKFYYGGLNPIHLVAQSPIIKAGDPITFAAQVPMNGWTSSAGSPLLDFRLHYTTLHKSSHQIGGKDYLDPDTINAVAKTGNQNISGLKNFITRPTVNGTGVLLSGEAAGLPNTLVYTTGNQIISGNKTFSNQIVFANENGRGGFISGSTQGGDSSLSITADGPEAKYIYLNANPASIRLGEDGVTINPGYEFLTIDNADAVLINGTIDLSAPNVTAYFKDVNANNIYAQTGDFNGLDLNNVDNLLISGIDIYVENGNVSLTNTPTVRGNPVLTGVDLTQYATISNLNLTGANLNNKINTLSGVSVLTYGNQDIYGSKTFYDNIFMNNLTVYGTGTIVNTSIIDVDSNYLILNVTGGAIAGGIFFVTGVQGSGLGPIMGYDLSNNKFKIGTGSRNGGITTLDNIATENFVNTNAVLISGNQSINGNKSFYGDMLLSGNNNRIGKSHYIETDNDFVYIRQADGNNILNSDEFSLYDDSNNQSVRFSDRILYAGRTIPFNESINWNQRYLANQNGSPVLTWTGDNIGIGTNNPSEKLQVVGNLRVDGNVSANNLNNLVYTTGNQFVSGIKIFGTNNFFSGIHVVIAGGSGNLVYENFSTVGGGSNNSATDCLSTVGGGSVNCASAPYSTIGGGANSCATAYASTIGGGNTNRAIANNSTIGGGISNLATGIDSIIGGGNSNCALGYYSTVGGGFLNCAVGCSSTIGGGNTNRATANSSTVGGGLFNRAIGFCSTIGGGSCNIASGDSSIVGGGFCNCAVACSSTVAGGTSNFALGYNSTIGGGNFNLASACYSTIPGGISNCATDFSSTVGGGYSNRATACYSIVGGGFNNRASGVFSTVGGGSDNFASGYASTIGGGCFNYTSSCHSTVGGGGGNSALDCYSTIGGGLFNVASGCFSIVAGGCNNFATAYASTVGGGVSNRAIGDLSTVGGGSNNHATANFSTIGGGCVNRATDCLSTIGGGGGNCAIGVNSTVGGGIANRACGLDSVIAGGSCNCAISYGSTIGGGSKNCASGQHSTVGGGLSNFAVPLFSTIGGGLFNLASGCVSTVAGGSQNCANAYASTIGGGDSNRATANFSTIGGGDRNCATAASSTIAGGSENCAIASFSTVGGGGANRAIGIYSTVGGGGSNFTTSLYSTVAGGTSNRATANSSTVAGGFSNIASGDNSTVGGGGANCAIACYSTVAGGAVNCATAAACFSIVGGGVLNCATNAYSTIAGGSSNRATEYASTVGGGISNRATNVYSTIAGGFGNISEGFYSTVGGGGGNCAIGYTSTVGGGFINVASGRYSTVAGGFVNFVSGSDSTIGGGSLNTIFGEYSYIPGGRCSIIQREHSGSAVLGDGQPRAHTSSGANSLTLDFASGVYFAAPSIFGNINFNSRPSVNGTGILLSGEAGVSLITIQDEGSSQGSASTLNFVGAGVSASVGGSTAIITINGGGGGISFVSPPVTPNSAGTSGQMALDQNYAYYCISNNNWRRSAIASW